MDKMKITLIFILNCLIIIGTTCFAATGIVNAPNGLVLRNEAAKGSEPIATISDKSKVEVIEKDGEWYKVKYNNEEGYLYGEYVTVNEEEQNKTEEKATETETKTEEQKEETKAENNNKQYPKKQKVKNETKMYIIPLVTAMSVGTVEKKQEVTINYELNDWLNITYGKKQGWARKHFVVGETKKKDKEENKEENKSEESKTKTVEERTVSNKKGYVDANSSVNVRKDASTSAKVIDTLSRNAEVTIIAEKGDFYKIKYNGITGYIAKSLISSKPVETVTSRSNSGERKQSNNSTKKTTNSTKQTKTSTPVSKSSKASGGSGVASYAKQYIGYSYVYGGTKPSTGFDCSGFTYYVFNSCGYKLSRSCQVQARSGKAVSRSNLQPGDLVFFNNTSDGGIGHVAIYIGGGRIVHAANSRSGVRTDTINSGYYNKYYYSARRIAQ